MRRAETAALFESSPAARWRAAGPDTAPFADVPFELSAGLSGYLVGGSTAGRGAHDEVLALAQVL